MSDTTSRVNIEINSSGDFQAAVRAREQTEALTKALEVGKVALASFGLGFGIEGLKTATESVFNLGKNIVDLSARLQISTQAFQVMGAVARESGLDQETMTTILGKLHGTIDTAAESGGKAAKAFEILGLSAKVLAQAPLERALEAIAVQVVTATDKTKAYAAAVEILGAKNVPKLMEVLKQLGTQGFDDASKKVDFLSEEQLKVLHDGGVAWEKFGYSVLLILAKIPLALKQSVAEFKQGFEDIRAVSAAFFTGGLDESYFHGPGAAAAKTVTQAPQLAIAQQLIADSAAQNLQDAAALNIAQDMKDEKKQELAIQKDITERVAAGLESTKKLAAAYGETVKQANELTDPFAKEEEQADKIQAAWQAGAMSLEDAKAALAVLNDQAWNKAVSMFGLSAPGDEGPGKQKIPTFDKSQDAYINSKSTDTDVNPNYLTASQGAQVALMNYVTKIGSAGQQIQQVFANVTNSIQGGLAKGLDGLLSKTMTLGQAFKTIWSGFIESAISAFSQMLAQYIVKKAAMFAVDELMAAKGLLLSLATSAKALVGWLPTAIAASISSYGLAAAIGTAAVIAAIAAGHGFEAGGYTGGSEGQFAGAVHGEEYVFSAPAVRNIGVSNLDGMHQMAKSGGSSSNAARRGSGSSGGDVHIFQYNDQHSAIQAALRHPGTRKMIVDAVNGRVRSVG